MFRDWDIDLGTKGYVEDWDMFGDYGICLGTMGYVWGLWDTFGDCGICLGTMGDVWGLWSIFVHAHHDSPTMPCRLGKVWGTADDLKESVRSLFF